MRNRTQTRHKSKLGRIRVAAIMACVPGRWEHLLLLAQNPAQAAPPANAVVLDRVVAVVNNQAILASDVDDEMRLAVLDPGRAGLGVLTPQRALEQLISRALIQQQIRQEDAQAAEPSQAEVDARLREIRREVPACVHLNCASEQGWAAFLAAHGLTPKRVESYLRYRVQILRFIEQRFRQGIRITPEEIESVLPRNAAASVCAGRGGSAAGRCGPAHRGDSAGAAGERALRRLAQESAQAGRRGGARPVRSKLLKLRPEQGREAHERDRIHSPCPGRDSAARCA